MRLLVTRPEPGASRTAAALAALGHEPVVLPLSRIVPVAAPDLAAAEPFDLVGAASVNALRHAPAALIARLRPLPCHVVGQATAAAARQAGFAVGHVAPGAAALCRWLAGHVPAGARIAWLCGRVRLDLFEEGSRAAGIEPVPVETYDTLSVHYSRDELARRFGNRPFEGALLYSRVAALGFKALMTVEGMAELFAGARLYCLSEGIAAAFGQGMPALVAAEPDESSMLARIGPAD